MGYEKCLAGGDIVVLKHKQNPKYLSYVLSTTMAQIQKGKGKVKSKVVHSSVPAIKELVIPVPPIEVQSEIVRILDNFTELTAELTAELTTRNKQYEYYRDKLLNEGVVENGSGNVEKCRGEASRARKDIMQTRKNIRLKEYDYSSKGMYFITICTKDKKDVFGRIVDNKMIFNDYGNKLNDILISFENEKYEIDYYQIMPNHIHFIVNINMKGKHLIFQMYPLT